MKNYIIYIMAMKQLSGNDTLIASEAERARLEVIKQQDQKSTISNISEQARGLINQGKSEVIYI